MAEMVSPTPLSIGRAPFNTPLYLTFQLLLIISTIPGPFTHNSNADFHSNTKTKIIRYALLATAIYITYYLITQTTTGNPAVDLAQGSALVTQLLTPIDLIFFTDPDSLEDLYHMNIGASGHSNTNSKTNMNGHNESANTKTNVRITTDPLLHRLKWTFNLFTNVRGIGWSHESPHTPPRPPPGTPRSSFVRARLWRGACCILVECAGYVLNASNPALTSSENVGLTKAPLIWRALATLGFASAGYARINWMNSLFSALIVGLGFSKPERWPDLFGSVEGAWSVERFWGRLWHHFLRKPLSAIASSGVSFLLRLPSSSAHNSRKTTISTSHLKSTPSTPKSTRTKSQKLLYLFLVFLTSGTVHIAGEVMLMGHIGFGAFTFFALQPFGIVFEHLVRFVWGEYFARSSSSSSLRSASGGEQEGDEKMIDSATNGNPKVNRNGLHTNGASTGLRTSNTYPQTQQQPGKWKRALGYLWVASWFVFSLPYMIAPMVDTGMFVDERVDMRRFF